MYPWDPPRVGVSEIVLKKLEDELWNKLHEMVSNLLPTFISSDDWAKCRPLPSPEAMLCKLELVALVRSRCR